MKNRILRYSDLETQLGMNRVTIWRRTRTDPTFPRPIRLGNSRNAAIGFLAEEIEAWIAQQAATARVERLTMTAGGDAREHLSIADRSASAHGEFHSNPECFDSQ